MDELQQRAARSIAMATLAVAFVVGGPSQRIADALERTYVVAVVDAQRRKRHRRDRVPAGRWRRRPGPRPQRPTSPRP